MGSEQFYPTSSCFNMAFACEYPQLLLLLLRPHLAPTPFLLLKEGIWAQISHSRVVKETGRRNEILNKFQTLPLCKKFGPV